MSKFDARRVTRLALIRFAFLVVCLAGVAGVARADIVGLGTMSWDELNPGATNGFTIINISFSFALPPDFPITGQVLFKNAQVLLTDGTGTALPAVQLGDLGPGNTLPVSLQFGSGQLFQSAEFQATLNGTTFATFDGKVFTADSTAIDALLLPISGPTLVAGVDLVPITATGTLTAAAVPEPSGWALLLTLVVGLTALRRFRNRAVAQPRRI